MSKVLFLSAPPVVFWTFPRDAHHHGDDDGDLDGADDGGNKDVVQLLATGDDVEDVKVVGLVA